MASVLVVDDTSFFRKLMTQYLTAGDHKVVAYAADGLSAVKAYAKYLPDFIIMDVVLPRVSGFDASSVIMKKYEEACIIMTSAINTDTTAALAFSSGAKDFLLKPFDQDILLTSMAKISRELQELRRQWQSKRGK